MLMVWHTWGQQGFCSCEIDGWKRGCFCNTIGVSTKAVLTLLPERFMRFRDFILLQNSIQLDFNLVWKGVMQFWALSLLSLSAKAMNSRTLGDSSHEYSSVYGRRYKSTVAFSMNISHFDSRCHMHGNRKSKILKNRFNGLIHFKTSSNQRILHDVSWMYYFMYFVTVSTSSITWPRWASTSIWSFNEWPPIWRTQTSSSSSPSSASFGCSNWPDTPQDSRSSFRPLELRPRSSCSSSSS